MLSCHCTYREYEPLEEYRKVCPYMLVVSSGIHSHPVPLPEKTPTAVKMELDTLLRKLDFDLADMTPRRFLRHSVVRSYLVTRFPLLRNPMLSDLHISLSNRSHLKVYLEKVKRDCFPAGTGWKGMFVSSSVGIRSYSQYSGLLNIKQNQDSVLQPEEHYIRAMLEIPPEGLSGEKDDEDDDDGVSPNDPLRIAICMTREGSRRFTQAQHLQSDIAFKRIIGFYEFEIAFVDEYTNTSQCTLMEHHFWSNLFVQV